MGRGPRTGSTRARSASPAASSRGSASPRALAVEPDILLMDESTSALDPISTSKIEDLAIESSKTDILSSW